MSETMIWILSIYGSGFFLWLVAKGYEAAPRGRSVDLREAVLLGLIWPVLLPSLIGIWIGWATGRK